MKEVLLLILLPAILLTVNTKAQKKKMLNGIATDACINGIVGINVIVKGTTAGVVSGTNGRFSIPIETDEFILVFHGMSYNDMRAYEIKLRNSDVANDTVVFQLGRLRTNCRKVNKRFK